MTKTPPLISGSGDVFRNLGLSRRQAAERNAKSALIDAFAETIQRRKLTQAAKLCATDQPMLSKVPRGGHGRHDH